MGESRITGSDPKADLHRYLQAAREAMLWKLDGLSEYDIRRPLTPTGTNLLGLVKHVASVEVGCFGATFGQPFNEPLPWFDDDAEPNADLWAPAAESREQVVGLYHRAWAHSDTTIEMLPLEAIGRVPWWPDDRSEVTLHRVLVHMIAETDRHAGHAYIVRELIDGGVGAAWPAGLSETAVSCAQRPVERLGECDVAGVVRGDVRAQLETRCTRPDTPAVDRDQVCVSPVVEGGRDGRELRVVVAIGAVLPFALESTDRLYDG